MIKRIIIVILFIMVFLGIIQISKGCDIKTCKITNQTRFFTYPLKQIILDRNISGNLFLLSGTLNNTRTYLFYINNSGFSYKLMEVYYKRVSISEVEGKPTAVLDTKDCICRCDSYGGCEPDKLIHNGNSCVSWNIFLPPGTMRTSIDVNIQKNLKHF